VTLNFFLSANQYVLTKFVNNQQLTMKYCLRNSRNSFIIIINSYFYAVIIFSCEISKLGFGKSYGK